MTKSLAIAGLSFLVPAWSSKNSTFRIFLSQQYILSHIRWIDQMAVCILSPSEAD
jgi:hypothetical protein